MAARYTKQEIDTVLNMRKEGRTVNEIAETLNRERVAVDNLLYRLRKKSALPAVKHPQKEEKTLSDFSPREMIRHLYFLGYRIENNSIVCYQKHIVNIKDIIS